MTKVYDENELDALAVLIGDGAMQIVYAREESEAIYCTIKPVVVLQKESN